MNFIVIAVIFLVAILIRSLGANHLIMIGVPIAILIWFWLPPLPKIYFKRDKWEELLNEIRRTKK